MLLALVATSLSISSVAFGESQVENKAAQCNKFTKIANKGQAILTGNSATKSPSDISRIADRLEIKDREPYAANWVQKRSDRC
ncbi:hypothetical protein TUMEXPCC7403_03640 [Tumidithrix helvetica PCC 7403]|uniref:hypothetical protein n=1 Tax=Tumidithrix helvetica TaxID=3457545 RepID=UPI003CA154CB